MKENICKNGLNSDIIKELNKGICVVFDTETTGLDPNVECMLELSALKLKEGKVVDKLNLMFNPKKPIPYKISELTGITDDMVKDAKTDTEQLMDIYNFFMDADIVVGHNVNFDIGFVDCAYRRNGYRCPLNFKYVDTLELARKYIKNVENHKLVTLAKYIGVDTSNAHRAMFDVEMTLGLLIYLCKVSTDK